MRPANIARQEAKTSPAFRFIMRSLLYLPVMGLLFLALRNYVGWTMARIYGECSQAGQTESTFLMRQVATCMLKKADNPLLRWVGGIDRYRYLASPVLPCRFVGKWLGNRDDYRFYSWMAADGTVIIEPIDGVATTALGYATLNGYWSTVGDDRLIWFYPEAFIWPLDENPIRWLDNDHLLITEMNGQSTSYRRLTPMPEGCQ